MGSLKQKFLGALDDPDLRKVNFSYEGFEVNYDRLQIARWLISSCAVEFEELPPGDMAGQYSQRHDIIRASEQGIDNDALAIELHEAVHLLQDREHRQRRSWTVWEAEAIAYLAEVIYLIRKHRSPDTNWPEYLAKIESRDFRPVRKVAARVAIENGCVQTDAQVYLTRTHIAPLERAVYGDPLYQPGTRTMNGIRNRSCRHA